MCAVYQYLSVVPAGSWGHFATCLEPMFRQCQGPNEADYFKSIPRRKQKKVRDTNQWQCLKKTTVESPFGHHLSPNILLSTYVCPCRSQLRPRFQNFQLGEFPQRRFLPDSWARHLVEIDRFNGWFYPRWFFRWLNQPIWKICSSNWKSAPGVKNFKILWNRHLVIDIVDIVIEIETTT